MDKVIVIKDELISMICTVNGFNPYDSVSLDTFYSTLSHIVNGGLQWRDIDEMILVESIKSMLPHYQPF